MFSCYFQVIIFSAASIFHFLKSYLNRDSYGQWLEIWAMIASSVNYLIWSPWMPFFQIILLLLYTMFIILPTLYFSYYKRKETIFLGFRWLWCYHSLCIVEGIVNHSLEAQGAFCLPHEPETESVHSATALHRFVAAIVGYIVVFIQLKQVPGTYSIAGSQQTLKWKWSYSKICHIYGDLPQETRTARKPKKIKKLNKSIYS